MATPPALPPPRSGINFESLPWNLNCPDEHFYIHLTTTGDWTNEEDFLAELERQAASPKHYGEAKLELTPATTSLNYGTTIWEGLKGYRVDDNNSFVFRPDLNYERMSNGAAELCLPMPSRRIFLRAVQLAVQINSQLLPPPIPGTKLYIRPMLMGTGQQLGLYPSPQFSFVVFVSPTGSYFSSSSSGLNLNLETKRSRAARGGMGHCKCSGNYAAALKPLMDCKAKGFSDNLYLELETLQDGNLEKALLQEMSAANVFVVLKSGEIVTPSLDRKTILPGITRRSVLDICETWSDDLLPALRKSTQDANVKLQASSRDVSVGELKEAVECFCTGTAAELVPIRRIANDTFECEFPDPGPVTQQLGILLRECMTGERKMEGWLRNPMADSDEFCA